MKKKIRAIVSSVILLCFSIGIFAHQEFIVRHIQVEGLEGITKETVLSYLPIKVGDSLTEQKSEQAIASLYKTGFFDNIRLEKIGDTLLIKVVQRPIISRISISGNDDIPTKKLKEALKKMSFEEGEVYSTLILEKIKGALESEYFIAGKYNARVQVSAKNLSRTRVEVSIDISEGKVSKIQQIKIIGNTSFSEKDLLKRFKLSTDSIFNYFNHNDQYSREKLTADLETLRSFYMDRGYIKFKIDSTQVLLSPDRKQVYLVVRITEGGQYRVSGYAFSGKLVLAKNKLEPLITIKRGDIFSRKVIMDINKNLMQLYVEKGYANVNIEAAPKIDDDAHTVFLNFQINPGSRVYVRQVTFSNHYRTNDEVLRREIQQMEGGVVSSTN